MHPIRINGASIQAPPAVLDFYRDQLKGLPLTDRAFKALGFIGGSLKVLADMPIAGQDVRAEIAEALAVYDTYKVLLDEEIVHLMGEIYEREDPIDDGFVLPAGIEGWHVPGRGAR